eukprot:CAMPEP_0204632754 /NCGR_PEP_ID=MMETSP0717-20131115/25598_1 /ASSEMBLY_ACC=CAM_ASM_000666 /TAXON_ID=230516 /ORGANISM="Chaetoceros curvisetus" /LENGTH=49 /DNA_ID=CAMNT_0051650691 /DNA_START=151 /DNA_END=300 /DNA_ORIENTATION=+
MYDDAESDSERITDELRNIQDESGYITIVGNISDVGRCLIGQRATCRTL